MKRNLDIEFNVLYEAYDVLHLVIYFPIKLTFFSFLK